MEGVGAQFCYLATLAAAPLENPSEREECFAHMTTSVMLRVAAGMVAPCVASQQPRVREFINIQSAAASCVDGWKDVQRGYRVHRLSKMSLGDRCTPGLPHISPSDMLPSFHPRPLFFPSPHSKCEN